MTSGYKTLITKSSTWIITVSTENVGGTGARSERPPWPQLRDVSNDSILTDLHFVCAQLSGPGETVGPLELDAEGKAAHFDGDQVSGLKVAYIVIVDGGNPYQEIVSVATIPVTLRHSDNLALKDCTW